MLLTKAASFGPMRPKALAPLEAGIPGGPTLACVGSSPRVFRRTISGFPGELSRSTLGQFDAPNSVAPFKRPNLAKFGHNGPRSPQRGRVPAPKVNTRGAFPVPFFSFSLHGSVVLRRDREPPQKPGPRKNELAGINRAPQTPDTRSVFGTETISSLLNRVPLRHKTF